MKIKDKINVLYYRFTIINIKTKSIELYRDVSKKFELIKVIDDKEY